MIDNWGQLQIARSRPVHVYTFIVSDAEETIFYYFKSKVSSKFFEKIQIDGSARN